MRLVGLFFIAILLFSCKEAEKDRIIRLVNEWEGKTIYYPDKMTLISYETDSVITTCNRVKSHYTILNYVDSMGCISCNLQLSKWKELVGKIDSISSGEVTCLFVFHPKHKIYLIKLLQQVHFNCFVYIDEADTLNRINKFLKNGNFQTFLLDKDNRVVAIGNPVHNPRVKDLYLKIITGENPLTSKKKLQTDLTLDKSIFDMGSFNWEQEQLAEFMLTNSGNELLVIDGVSTSCGCTTVEYSKEPVQTGKNLILKVRYKAEYPEHFNKTISVYCNTKDAPLQLKISGNAK